jgi:hypothetical protein
VLGYSGLKEVRPPREDHRPRGDQKRRWELLQEGHQAPAKWELKEDHQGGRQQRGCRLRPEEWVLRGGYLELLRVDYQVMVHWESMGFHQDRGVHRHQGVHRRQGRWGTWADQEGTAGAQVAHREVATLRGDLRAMAVRLGGQVLVLRSARAKTEVLS